MDGLQGELLQWKLKYEDQVRMEQARKQGDVHGEEAHIATVKAQLQASEEIQDTLQAGLG